MSTIAMVIILTVGILMALIRLAIMPVLFVICGIIIVIGRIAYTVKKHQQKRIKEIERE